MVYYLPTEFNQVNLNYFSTLNNDPKIVQNENDFIENKENKIEQAEGTQKNKKTKKAQKMKKNVRDNGNNLREQFDNKIKCDSQTKKKNSYKKLGGYENLEVPYY